jgi:hypothetical protein
VLLGSVDISVPSSILSSLLERGERTEGIPSPILCKVLEANGLGLDLLPNLFAKPQKYGQNRVDDP